MPKIDTPVEARATYDEMEIRKLIMRDLAENYGITAKIADVCPLITGGGDYRRADNSYSGGFNDSEYEAVAKAQFTGYAVIGKLTPQTQKRVVIPEGAQFIAGPDGDGKIIPKLEAGRKLMPEHCVLELDDAEAEALRNT